MRFKKTSAFIALIFLMSLLLPLLVRPAEASFDSDNIFSSIFGPVESEEFHKVLPLKADGTFSLKNVNGSISITTWKKDKVEIKAKKTTKASRSQLKLVRIEVESTSNSIYVDTIYPRRRNIRVKVNYDVKVPEGVNLKKVRSVNGNVSLYGPMGNVYASTTNGKIELDGASGEISLSSTNGDIDAVSIRGELDVDTTNGDIKLEMRSFEDEIDIKTVNGGITLRFGSLEKIDADLKIRTVNGRIYLDFPVTLQSLRQSRRSLEGRIGKGGHQLTLRTVNGSIRITR